MGRVARVRFSVAFRRAVAAALLAAAMLATAAIAEAPITPAGNFGGGALVAPPKPIDGAGNAIVALRALPKRRLEIEATVRARCAGGDIAAATKVSAGGSFSSEGTVSQQPDPALKITTTYELSGRFTSRGAAAGTLERRHSSARCEGRTTTCRSGTVKFAVRRPDRRPRRPRRAEGRALLRHDGAEEHRPEPADRAARLRQRPASCAAPCSASP